MTSSYGRALSMLASCPYFHNGGRVIFDPSGSIPDGVTPAPRDADLGFSPTEVPRDTPAEKVGTYMILGNLAQPDLGIPPTAWIPKSGRPYTIDSNKECVAYDNVGRLDSEFALLKRQGEAGHPSGNRGVKFGTNLVAFADDGNPLAVLIWSSQPYQARQQSSMMAS